MSSNQEEIRFSPCTDTVIKRRCHSCKQEFAESQSVACREDHCCKFFCQRCLTSRYKYSKTKAATLPSLNWKCPVCTKRCFCPDCIATGNVPKKRKAISKKASYTTRRRTRKRARPRCQNVLSAAFEQTNESAKCRVCGRKNVILERISHACSSCTSPSSICTKRPPHILPPATLMDKGDTFSFASAFAAKEISSEQVRTSIFFPPFMKMMNKKTVPLLSVEVYAQMSALECMKIGFAPFMPN